MASENQYSKAVLPLKGGLDFVDESLDANRGTLSDCLNYEVSDRLGYSRIGGYERYDQGAYTSSDVYTKCVLIIGTEFLNFTEGEKVIIVDPDYKGASDEIGTFLGMGSFVSEDQVYSGGVVVLTNYEAFLSLVQGVSEIKGVDSAEIFTFSLAISYTAEAGAAAQTEELNDLFYADNIARTAPNVITGGTANGPITGLKRYKENLYAISDFLVSDFTLGEEEVFPGDILTDFTHGGTARVVAISVTGGSYAGGDAVGTILLRTISGTNPFVGEQTVVRPSGTLTALDITGLSSDGSWGAGLWKTVDDGGWEEVNIGYEFTFKDGSVNGPPPVFQRGAGNASVVPTSNSSGCTVASQSGGWVNNGGATPLECVETDDAKYVSLTTTTPYSSAYIETKAFTSQTSLPTDSEITGFSVKVVANGAKTGAGPYYPRFSVQPVNNTGNIGTAKYTDIFPEDATFSDSTVGGPNDSWSVADLKTALTNGFGLRLFPVRFGTGSTNFKLDYVELTIHYSDSIESYYFYDRGAGNDVLAPITNYYVDEGDWTTGDAHGLMQVASITPVGASVRTYIQAGNEIWTGVGGTGSFMGNVESNATYAYLPALPQLQEEDSRYQLIVANFYGNEDWETLYGASGAGQAFAYDGYYFRHIYTGIAPDLDKPRHIAYNQGALSLGYGAGNVTFSVPGQPENYSGVLGATSIDLGDPVTGLVRMSGTALGVFCRGSTNTITGTNIDNYSSTVISASEGAIEYTVVDIGQPLFCSNKGISLIDQTAAYGGFLGGRLSEAITPWLLPRIQRTQNPLPVAGLLFTGASQSTYSASVGIMFATVNRSKNQYRLYFEDGACLTMTLQGAAREPTFTLQRYDKWTTPEDKDDGVLYSSFIPLACTSDIDNLGREHIHMSHYSSSRDAAAGETIYYAYEFDNSWSFEGYPIRHSLTLNENFFGDVFAKNRMAKVAAHGLSYGYAPLNVAVGVEYGAPVNTARAAVDISLPRTPTQYISAGAESVMNIADVSSRGRSFNFRLFYPFTGDGVVCPPFSVQMLLIQYIEGKGDV